MPFGASQFARIGGERGDHIPCRLSGSSPATVPRGLRPTSTTSPRCRQTVKVDRFRIADQRGVEKSQTIGLIPYRYAHLATIRVISSACLPRLTCCTSLRILSMISPADCCWCFRDHAQNLRAHVLWGRRSNSTSRLGPKRNECESRQPIQSQHMI
jgi:hypothetical protein